MKKDSFANLETRIELSKLIRLLRDQSQLACHYSKAQQKRLDALLMTISVVTASSLWFMLSDNQSEQVSLVVKWVGALVATLGAFLTGFKEKITDFGKTADSLRKLYIESERLLQSCEYDETEPRTLMRDYRELRLSLNMTLMELNVPWDSGNLDSLTEKLSASNRWLVVWNFLPWNISFHRAQSSSRAEMHSIEQRLRLRKDLDSQFRSVTSSYDPSFSYLTLSQDWFSQTLNKLDLNKEGALTDLGIQLVTIFREFRESNPTSELSASLFARLFEESELFDQWKLVDKCLYDFHVCDDKPDLKGCLDTFFTIIENLLKKLLVRENDRYNVEHQDRIDLFVIGTIGEYQDEIYLKFTGEQR